MFNFLIESLYPKFESNEEIREIVVDALISVASNEEHIENIKAWLETEFSLSPE